MRRPNYGSDGGGWTPDSLIELSANSDDSPQWSKLGVLLPIEHEGESAIFTWSILEGENAQFSRHPDPAIRLRFACALALRAHDQLEELAEDNPDVVVDPFIR